MKQNTKTVNNRNCLLLTTEQASWIDVCYFTMETQNDDLVVALSSISNIRNVTLADGTKTKTDTFFCTAMQTPILLCMKAVTIIPFYFF